MDDKKAAAILLKLLNNGSLSVEEKEAVKKAVGVLSWTSLSEGRLRDLKNKQDKDLERAVR